MTVGAAATVAAYLLRWMAARWTLDRDQPVRDAAVVGVMIPKGLAAAVLASVPMVRGLEGAHTIQSAAFAVVLTSISLTAVLVILLERPPIRGWAAWWFRAFAGPAVRAAAAGTTAVAGTTATVEGAPADPR
jgi:hypothetical protein